MLFLSDRRVAADIADQCNFKFERKTEEDLTVLQFDHAGMNVRLASPVVLCLLLLYITLPNANVVLNMGNELRPDVTVAAGECVKAPILVRLYWKIPFFELFSPRNLLFRRV
jgi:hypothetical protein